MDILNDENSSIFKETIEKQKKYIDKRRKVIINRILETNIKFQGNTKEEIALFLNLGIAQNLVQAFFKFKEKKCLICKKDKSDVRQLERAHCNLYSRYDLLIKALDNIYVDIDTPINSVDILKEFIKCHSCCPIYYLCKSCHIEYDKIEVAKV